MNDVTRGLRLVIYDATQRGKRGLPGLSRIWALGAWWYRRRGAVDAVCAARSWPEALDFLASHEPDRPIDEVQFWMHGKPGRVLVNKEAIDRSIVSVEHPLNERLHAWRERMRPEGRGLIWFRTCGTLCGTIGQRFAIDLARFMSAHVAGFTHTIWFSQSGLQIVAPGSEASWSASDGLRAGNPENPERTRHSQLWLPNTVTCLHTRLDGWREFLENENGACHRSSHLERTDGQVACATPPVTG